MTNRRIPTRTILASIHAFPGIMAAGRGITITQAFDELRDAAPKIAGIPFGRDHLSWRALAGALKSVLASSFNELAAEEIPDQDFWSAPKDGPDFQNKLNTLGRWVEQVVKKYGETVEVPNISADVKAALELD